jgi:hypothetical protein
MIHSVYQSWLFLTDHLNMVNLQLYGKAKTPGKILCVLTAFQNITTTLFIPDRQFANFPKLRAVTTSNPDMLQYFSYDAFVRVLEELKLEFESRFKNIMEYKEILNFIENPFHVPVSSLTPAITALCPDHAGIESETVELQANDTLQV